jgi:hypothetical protein
MFNDDPKCPILSAAVFQDDSDLTFNKELSEIVTMDPNKFLIDVENNSEESKTVDFVIKVKTVTNAYGYKKVEIVYKLPEDIPIPKFKGKLLDAKVSRDDENFSYTSPKIVL